MKLQLKNIGMIKEANVKLDGLTVIAGENDTGKSTVGKALFAMLKGISYNPNEDIDDLLEHQYNWYFLKIFNQKFIAKDTYVSLIKDGKKYFVSHPVSGANTFTKDHELKQIIFIETPIVWNFIDFFKDIALVESQMNIKLDYPYLMKDLSFKMAIKTSNDDYINVKDKLISLMGGEFRKDDLGKFYFDKKDTGRVEIVNTATGIKSFGILQMLSQNGWLNNESVLILDEPEVHLHPKWQLKMAKVIVELAKNGVKVLVNSHSPYMIEALKRYSDVEEIEEKTNFYLAGDGYIRQIEESNSKTLVEIYEKLSEPYDTFEEMDSQRMGKLING